MSARTWGSVVDLVAVLLFAFIGRLSHGESAGPVGLLTTALPFVLGATAGRLLVLVLGLRRPSFTVPAVRSGVIIWVCTVVIGMLLRVGLGAGVAVSFVIVAAAVLGVFLLGWRWLTRLVVRRRRVVAVRGRSWHSVK